MLTLKEFKEARGAVRGDPQHQSSLQSRFATGN